MVARADTGFPFAAWRFNCAYSGLGTCAIYLFVILKDDCQAENKNQTEKETGPRS